MGSRPDSCRGVVCFNLRDAGGSYEGSTSELMVFHTNISYLTGSKDPDRRSDNVARLWRIFIQTHQVGKKIICFIIMIIWRTVINRNLGVNEVRLASAFLNGSFPLWVRRIHFVNQPRSFLVLTRSLNNLYYQRIFGILMNLVKPFLSENAKV